MSANLGGPSLAEEARGKNELIVANRTSSEILATELTSHSESLASQEGMDLLIGSASDHPDSLEPDFTRTRSIIRTKKTLSLVFVLTSVLFFSIVVQSSKLSRYVDRIVLTQVPNSAEAHAMLAQDLAFETEKTYEDEAISEWSKAIALDQSNPRYYSERADVYDKKDEFQKAYNDESKAIELQHDKGALPWCYAGRANAAYELRRWQDCIKDSDQVIAMDPSVNRAYEPNIYEMKASSLEHIGKAQEALAVYTRSIEVASLAHLEYDKNSALFARAGFFRRQHDYQGALLDYNACLDNSAYQDPERLTARGRLLAKLGENDKALNDLNKAIESDPKMGNALFYRSMLLKRLGKLSEAAADDQALKKLPLWSPPREDEER